MLDPVVVDLLDGGMHPTANDDSGHWKRPAVYEPNLVGAMTFRTRELLGLHWRRCRDERWRPMMVA